MLHYYPRHVSSINTPIFRRTNCIFTASGIFAPCKRLHSTPVESGLVNEIILVVEKIKTHFMFNHFFPENSVVYEIIWIKYGRDRQATDDNIMQRICFACCIIMATDTHSEYVILTAFPRNK